VSALISPFTWWHTGDSGWQTPSESPVLYRTDEWVARFLGHIDAELRRIELTAVNTFETNRAALVVTGGESATQTLRLNQALYRDILLFHPGLHPEVDDAMEQVLADASEVFAREGNPAAEKLRRGGRDLLLAEPKLLLHESVVTGLADLGLWGLPPVGVSAIVDVRVDDETYLLGVVRSGQVAVNPRLPRAVGGRRAALGRRRGRSSGWPDGRAEGRAPLVGRAADRPVRHRAASLVVDPRGRSSDGPLRCERGVSIVGRHGA